VVAPAPAAFAPGDEFVVRAHSIFVGEETADPRVQVMSELDPADAARVEPVGRLARGLGAPLRGGLAVVHGPRSHVCRSSEVLEVKGPETIGEGPDQGLPPPGRHGPGLA
jgi:hypothetical protein